MRTISIIKAEIVELSAIKSTYTHFLASYEAQIEVENATLVENNKRIISENLKKLYAELTVTQKALANTDEVEKNNNKYQNSNDPQKTQNTKPDTRNLRMKFVPYIASELEERAIMHFYSDKRYTITE